MIIIILFIVQTTLSQQFPRITYQCDFIQQQQTIIQTWGYWNDQQCIQCKQWCTCSEYMGCSQLSCPLGYVAYTDNMECIECPKGCNQCKLGYQNNIKSCQECIEGYQLIGKMCIELTVFQIKTSQIREAYMTYTNPYSQQLNNNFSICKTLNSKTSLCQSCQDGYFLNEFNQCESCPTGCFCQQRGTCQYCFVGYYYSPIANQNNLSLNSQSTIQSGLYKQGSISCVKCEDPNASDCLAGFSAACKEGYYLDSQEGVCISCYTGCLICTTITTCDMCQLGYSLQQDGCKLCNGNQLNEISCNKCDTNGKCQQCVNEYTLINDSYCINCSQKYQGCVLCNDSQCKQCNNGYYLQNGNCVECGQNILYCNNDNGQPTQCQQNYLLVKNTQTNQLVCMANINNCMKMIDQQQQCELCYPQYILYKGKCVQCNTELEGCLECTVQSDQLICTSCISNNQNGLNYYLNSNICTKCQSNCLNCLQNGCQTCIDRYYLNNQQCSNCLINNCQTCINQESTCQTCLSGYFLLNNICYLCPFGCSQCDQNQCSQCQEGFILKNNTCTIGTIFCSNYDEFGQCLDCMYGFALRNKVCVSCIDFTSGYVCGKNAEPCYLQLLISTIIILLFLN